MPSITLALERAGVVQRRQRPTGPQVGVQPEALAESEQALLGAGLVGIGRVPLGAADRGQQHRVGAPAGRERLVGQRRAVGVDRGAAEDVLLVLELGPTASSTSTAGAMISGPIPSPGSRTILGVIGSSFDASAPASYTDGANLVAPSPDRRHHPASSTAQDARRRTAAARLRASNCPSMPRRAGSMIASQPNSAAPSASA